MRTLCIPAIALFIAGLPLPALAQLEVSPRVVTRAWPVATWPAGTFTRVFAADITGDGALEGFAVHNRTLKSCYDVEVFTSFSEFLEPGHPGFSVNDAGALIGTGVDGRDEVLAVGSSGLERGSFTYADGFDWTNVFAGAWQDSLKLRVRSESGISYIAALGIDSQTLRVAGHQNGRGFLPLGDFDVGETVVDYVLVDLAGSGVPSLVVQTRSELKVFDLWGVPGASYPAATAHDDGAVAVLRFSGVGAEQVAWVSRSGSTWNLSVVDAGGIVERILPLDLSPDIPANFSVLGLSSGDIDGDGTPDLALTPTESHRVILFLGGNTGNPFTISDQTTFFVTFPGDASSTGLNHCPAALIDINHTGRVDLLTARKSEEAVKVVFGLRQSIWAQGTLGPGDDENPEILFEDGELDNTLPVHELSVKLTVPNLVHTIWNPTHVLVSLWHQRVPQGPPDLTDAQALDHRLYDYHGERTRFIMPFEGVTSWDRFDVYYLQLRFYNSLQQTLSPAYVFGYSAEDHGSYDEVMDHYLRNYTNGSNENEVRVNGMTNRNVGGMKTRPIDPPFPVNQVPNPGMVQDGISSSW